MIQLDEYCNSQNDIRTVTNRLLHLKVQSNCVVLIGSKRLSTMTRVHYDSTNRSTITRVHYDS